MGAKMLISKSHDETANGDANLHNWIANRQNRVGDSANVNKLPSNSTIHY
jgi:hypothetical protein